MQDKIRILIVDSDQAIRRLLRTALTAAGYDTIEALRGEEALLQTVNGQPDLIILDLDLPDSSGFEIIRRVRAWSAIPIIVLTLRNLERDKIEALDAGANDYVTKPFSMGELPARLRVALRQARPEAEEPIFTTGRLTVDLAARQIWVDGHEVQVTPTEYDLLYLLVRHAGRVLTHQQILRDVRGVGYQTETHLQRVHMSNLRHKIEADPANPNYILTEPGVGYRLATTE